MLKPPFKPRSLAATAGRVLQASFAAEPAPGNRGVQRAIPAAPAHPADPARLARAATAAQAKFTARVVAAPPAPRRAEPPATSVPRPGAMRSIQARLTSATNRMGPAGVLVPDTLLATSPPGAGVPLPPAVQQKFEALLGASLADVRVHVGPQPATIGAIAFTTGSDLYFAPGHYPPTTAAGAQLLTRQLDRVLQQRAGRATNPFGHGLAVVPDAGDDRPRLAPAPPPGAILRRLRARGAARHPMAAGATIQRKIGFEFQCRKLQALVTGTSNLYKPAKGRNGAFLVTDEWYVTSDGGDVEFVVDPPLEEDDAKGLLRIMKQIVKTADGMGKGVRYKLNKIDVTIPKLEGAVTADPQITVGVSYSRLSALFDLLAQRDPLDKSNDSEANKLLMQNTAVKHYRGDDLLIGKVKAYISDLVYQERSPRHHGLYFDYLFPGLVGQKTTVVGLLTLLGTYVAKGPKLGHAYIKDFPVLAKTDIGVVVENSPFGAIVFDEEQVEWMLNALSYGRSNLDEQIYDAKKLGSEDPQEDGPTIRQWITTLFTKRKDLLSYRYNKDFADDSMGNLGRLDRVGGGGLNAPILELRRINDSLATEVWPAFAERARAWIERLNDPNQLPGDF